MEQHLKSMRAALYQIPPEDVEECESELAEITRR